MLTTLATANSAEPRCHSLMTQVLSKEVTKASLQQNVDPGLKLFRVTSLGAFATDDEKFAWLVKHTGFSPLSLRKNDILEKHKFNVAIPLNLGENEDYRLILEYSVKGALRENDYTPVVKKQNAFISKYYILNSKDHKINLDINIIDKENVSENLFIQKKDEALDITHIENTLNKIKKRIETELQTTDSEKPYITEAQIKFLNDLYHYSENNGVNELKFYSEINESVIKRYEDFMQHFYYTPDKTFKLNRDLEDLQILNNFSAVKSYYYKLRAKNFWAWLRNRGYRQAGNLVAFGLFFIYIDDIKTLIGSIANRDNNNGSANAKLSREFKLILDEKMIFENSDGIEVIIEKITEAASKHTDIIPRFSSSKIQYSDKDVEFFDTANGDLKKKGFSFRQRNKEGKDDVETTLKFRSPSPTETLVVQDIFDSRFKEDKLEEDLYPILDKNGVPHITGDFSYSASVKIKDDNAPQTMADFYNKYPQLKSFVDLDPKTPVGLIQDQKIVEKSTKIGEVEINDTVADIELSIWEVYQNINGENILVDKISELSLKQRSDNGLMNFESRSVADDFLKTLSESFSKELLDAKNKSEAATIR